LRLFVNTGEFSPTQVLAGAAVGAGKSRAHPLLGVAYPNTDFEIAVGSIRCNRDQTLPDCGGHQHPHCYRGQRHRQEAQLQGQFGEPGAAAGAGKAAAPRAAS